MCIPSLGSIVRSFDEGDVFVHHALGVNAAEPPPDVPSSMTRSGLQPQSKSAMAKASDGSCCSGKPSQHARVQLRDLEQLLVAADQVLDQERCPDVPKRDDDDRPRS